MGIESDKIRQDVEKGPAPRNYNITVDQDEGRSLQETQQIEDIVNTPSSFETASQPPISSSFAIAQVDIPPPTQRNSVAWLVASVNRNLDTTQSVKDHYTDAVANLDLVGEEPVINGAIAAYKNWYDGITRGMVDGLIADGTEADLDGLGADLQEIAQQNKEILSGPDALEQANILAITGDVNRGLAERQYYMRKLQDLTKDTPWWENTLNVLDMFIPDMRKDASDLTGGSWANAVRDSQVMMGNFQSANQEERMKMFPGLVTDVMAASEGNEWKAISKLMQFIDPSRKSEVDLEGNLDLFDWAAIAAPLILGVSRSIRGYNAAKLLATAGDKPLAGKVNAATLSDETEQIADMAGSDRTVAAANTSPFNWEAHGVAEATDGISVETVKTLEEISKVQSRLRPELERIGTGAERLSEVSLTPLEAKLAENAAVKDIKGLQESYYENFGHWPEGAEIVSRNPEGNSFTVGYKLAGVDLTKDVTYRTSDVGRFEVLEASAVATKIFSPSVWMEKITSGAVDAATRIGFSQMKLARDLQKAAINATKDLGSPFLPTGKKSRVKVDNILLAMDGANKGKGRVFTIAEMKSAPYNLTDKEIAATFGMRDFFDLTHFMKDNQVSNSLNFQGFKHATLIGDVEGAVGRGRPYIGKPFEEFAHIPSDITNNKTLRYWSSTGSGGKGSMVDSSFVNLKKRYEEGFKLIRLRSSERFGDELTNLALVRDTKLKAITGPVLNKKVAYVPKIAEDGFYFVKQSIGIMMNGKALRAGDAGADLRTVRMFDNKTDADTYAESLRNSTIDPITNKGLDPGKVRYDVKHDRELTPTQRENEIVNEAGGIFGSSRASHEITYGLDGDTPRRLSAFDAAQRNINHISTNIPMNNFRMGMQQRWLNSAIDDNGRPLISTPGDFNSPIIAELGSKAEVALRESRNWIKDQMSIPTDSEIRWEARSRRMAEWMEGRPILDTKVPFTENASIRRMTQVIGHTDPLSSMRASAFHLLLGWFNPSQLFVQAQGASIAFALDPLAAPGLMRQYMALRAGLWTKGKGAEVGLRKTAKAAGLPEDEFLELMEQYNKSGFGNIRTNADTSAAASGYWTGSGAIRNLANKGLFMFGEGEGFVRGYSFLFARKSWKKANPGKKIDDIALKAILTDATRKTMNMTRANRAYWQKGIWSIPTQFQQVTAKFIENMMPSIMPGAAKNFTGAEKSRIMMGQWALYGAAGIPMGEWVMDELAHAAGREPTDQPTSAELFARDGFYSWLSSETMGVNFEFGERGAFADGITNMINSVVRDDIPIHSFLGPFKTVPMRGIKVMEAISPMVMSFDDLEVTAQEIAVVATSIASLTSTWNNIHKARSWHKMGSVTDSKGNALFEIDTKDASGRDMLMLYGQGLGIAPTRINEYYKKQGFVNAHKEMKKEKLESIKKLWSQYAGAGDYTEVTRRNFRVKAFVLLQDLSEWDQKKIQKQFAAWSIDRTDKEARLALDALKSHLDSGEVNLGGKSILYDSTLNNAAEGNK